MADPQTHFRTCSLCEATCGLTITTRDGTVVGIRGDDDDVLSRGYLCPKGPALKALHEDPDRLRQPMVRRGERWHTVSWDDAFAEIDRGLAPILREHGRDAAAIYLGNPSAHLLPLIFYPRALIRAVGTRNVFSASTVDQMPKQVSAGLMFGTALSIPVPDVDRTHYFLVIGADPLVSNGSLMTAPDMRGRMKAIRERGGTIVVVDPRRSRTAEAADRHHFIRPGTDALFLGALAHLLLDDAASRLGPLAAHIDGLDALRPLLAPFTPARVAAACGIAEPAIRTIARELASAPSAAVYGRVGTTQQRFGTIASWLVDVVNVLTGNLDRPGGAMFTKAAVGATNTHGTPGRGRGVRFGRRQSRVSGYPEVFGELPAACLAEEIETPGEGRVRALITIAGNPVLSTPNGPRLARALGSLDFMVSHDIYRNETTRHAHVILPGLSALETPHYDVALWQLAVRNIANYSPPVFPPPTDRPQDWEIVLRLVGIASGQGPAVDTAALDDMIAAQLVASAANGRDADAMLAALAPRRGPERLLDLQLRTGPYGDGFGTNPDGLTLARLEANPHGVDLGPLMPRIPEVLRTPTGKIELAPPAIVADLPRVVAALDESTDGLLLVGRRHLHSNNSWMHNLEPLVRGKVRCTLHLHPTDAARIGVDTGDLARVRSRVGSVDVAVEVTDGIMPGVASIPHGWGHDAEGTDLRVARAHAGVNANALADEAALDPLSGTSVLNGTPISVTSIPV